MFFIKYEEITNSSENTEKHKKIKTSHNISTMR